LCYREGGALFSRCPSACGSVGSNLHHSVSVAICYRAATGLLPMPSILQVKGAGARRCAGHGQSTSRSFDNPVRGRRMGHPGRGDLAEAKDRADRTVCV